MNQEPSFETLPFELAPEFAGEMFEVESERGSRRSFGRSGGWYSQSPSLSGLRPKGVKRPPIAKPRPLPKKRRRPWGVGREPYGIVSEPYPIGPEPLGSERVRWLQDCLNQAIGTQLPVTGVVGPETRSAVRRFQRQQGLRTTGIAGPDTEEALRVACENRGDQPSSEELEFGAIYESEWMEMELPAAFRDNYSRLLTHMLPADQGLWATRRCYRLSQYHRAPQQRGVYLLIFRHRSPSGHIGYVGESENLRERMQGYRRDAIFFGLNPDNYAFCWVLTSQHKAIEEGLRAALNPTGLVTNQRELEIALESPFNEAEEIELAAELLSISSEEELDQFLGKLFKGIGRGIKKAGRFIGKRVLPVLGKGLKAIGKVALPVVGKALGSFIPIPGVGTAIGGAVGTALSKALELEFSGLNAEEAELEKARRFVRIAGTAARQAALADPNADPQAAVRTALMAALRRHVPNLPASLTDNALQTSGAKASASTGRWVRRGRTIVVERA
ncbi:peptidoglycan-binding domain-containing protein [Nitrosomonas sp. Nm132]|uniref:peptidoglycan-binding domain-containing protein n=1 Tax=Nitrosomonas sp. Nm132 TaxID=1881053 RepID=UPI000889CFDF|nr:peptidoglycan-binding domain-containing protein [Nitrosomonas sp. Nm132]SDG93767.1 Putative peptidoglycan binding domain-containing protein [Nitrosomonas sp. Nm132]